MALERNSSLFVSDPTKVAGLEKNDLMLVFGYSYYAGAPWTVGHHRGRHHTILYILGVRTIIIIHLPAIVIELTPVW